MSIYYKKPSRFSLFPTLGSHYIKINSKGVCILNKTILKYWGVPSHPERNLSSVGTQVASQSLPLSHTESPSPANNNRNGFYYYSVNILWKVGPQIKYF